MENLEQLLLELGKEIKKSIGGGKGDTENLKKISCLQTKINEARKKGEKK